MRTQDAIRLINDELTKPPGWYVHAYAGVNRFDDEAEVRVEIERYVTNSTPRSIDSRPEVMTGAAFAVQVRGMSESQVIAQFIGGLVASEEHEIREFVRFRSSGHAPFHPHRADGNQLFRRHHRLVRQAQDETSLTQVVAGT